MDADHIPPLTAAVFDRLRDRIQFAVGVVVEVLEAAGRADEAVTLAQVRPELHEPLRVAVVVAQQIWFDTPVRNLLTRPEAVHLDTLPQRAVGRVSASCYVELALTLTGTLVRAIAQGAGARSWFNYMFFATACGDGIFERWLAIGAEAACECAAAAEGLRTAQKQSGNGSQRWSRSFSVAEWRRILRLSPKAVTAELQLLLDAGRAERVSRQAWRLDLEHLDQQQLEQYESARVGRTRAN